MKIISLSSSIAGPACAVAKSIKKHFYNNNYATNMFDYLQISLLSILQILYLKNDDINYLNLNNEIFLNKDGNNSVKFNNFDKLISHHDLIYEYSEDDYTKFIQKYIRRYYRLINDIKKEDKIFFIRYGTDGEEYIIKIISIIQKINPNLKIYFIVVDYNKIDYKIDNKNYIYINFYDYNKNNIDESIDIFYRTMDYDWHVIYNVIFNNLNSIEQENFKYYFN
jgi:hypothetical protein